MTDSESDSSVCITISSPLMMVRISPRARDVGGSPGVFVLFCFGGLNFISHIVLFYCCLDQMCYQVDDISRCRFVCACVCL